MHVIWFFLPSNISFKGERVVCLLFKAMNGLRRAPLLWFYELQRTVYNLGGEDTFESTLFRISTKKGLILILVCVDDLLIASQDQKQGEDFLAKLMAIWKMKITGRIGRQTKGALEFLGRSIYRAKDGESALYFGVSRQYMVGIFESWGENIKAGHTGLMPKLEDVHKECVKKCGEDPLTEKGEQRYRRVLGQLAWAALSRADLSFPISFLSRFQAKPDPVAEQCMRVFLKWLSANLHFVQRMPAAQCSSQKVPYGITQLGGVGRTPGNRNIWNQGISRRIIVQPGSACVRQMLWPTPYQGASEVVTWGRS